MLDYKVFLKCLNYIDTFYLKWEFDFTNDAKLAVWYDQFKNLDNDFFERLVKNYCSKNHYPPQSPFDLLNVIQQAYAEKELDCEQAWDYVLGLVRRYGLMYNSSKIYNELKDKPLLEKLVKDFEPKLRDLRTDDINTPREFKNAYKANLASYTQEKAQAIINKTLKIENKQKKELEYNGSN